MQPRIWALCAFSRPERLGAVVAEFLAQTYDNKFLVLVENGPALGACVAAGVVPDLLLQSEQHQSAAKNVGLAAFEPDDWFVIWDDDDYHGCNFLTGYAAAAEPGVVIGKSSFFMRLANGRLIRFVRPGHMLWGGTLAARVGDAVPFENTGRWGEDDRWLRRMIALGYRRQALDEWNFIVNRGGGSHAWIASDELALGCLLGDRPDVTANDFGIVDDAVVDGAGEMPAPTILPPRSFDWELARNEMTGAYR